MVEICSACNSDGDNVPSVGNCNSCNKPLCEDHCNIHKKKGHVVIVDEPEEEFQLVFDNEDLTKISNEEQEQINVLCNNLLETVSKTEERINSYNIVTRKITSSICSPLIKKMRKEIEELRTKGTSYCNVYLVGNTGSAKTTIFNTVLGKPVTKEEHSLNADTKGPNLQICESLLCNIIDTAGYADELTKANAMAVFNKCKEYPPDIILFCFTPQTLKESTHFKTIHNKCLELSKKGISPAPIIPVLTKIDQLWVEETFTEDEIICHAKEIVQRGIFQLEKLVQGIHENSSKKPKSGTTF